MITMNMKYTLILLLAAAVAVPGFAQEKKKASIYKKYQVFQNVPVKIEDPDAINNYKSQLDFTVPQHGPWLTNPRPDGMTITWITRAECAGGIEYREKGTEEFKRLWPLTYGQIDFTRKIQYFHLTGLKPDTEYEYRFLSNISYYGGAYHGLTCVGREIYSFRTMNPEKQNYRVFMTADFHGTGRLCMDPVLDRTGAMESDFFFFLGDNVEDGPGIHIEYYITFGFLDDITRRYGTSKPTIFLRGNHDIWGRDTYKYGDYFPAPDGKTYQAFRQGPVLFICLDSMWRAKEKLQNEQHIAYLQEQADWVRALKKTDAWKKSKFRVVMAHVAPFANESTFVEPHWLELFQDATPEGRIHVFLSGHMHCYYRINPGEKNVRFINEFKDMKEDAFKKSRYLHQGLIPDNVPYTNVSLHLVEGMTLDVSADKLVFKSHRWSKPEGGLYDEFTILPDGKVVDGAKVQIYELRPAPPVKKKK